ncbi:hypothetical protein ACKFKH_31020, partial [Phormidesmis sp. 146-20]
MPITHRTYTRPARVPRADELVIGQLSINAADGKLFIKLTDGRVVCVGIDINQLVTDSSLAAFFSNLQTAVNEALSLKASSLEVSELQAAINGKPSFSDIADIEELETALNGLNATIAGKPSFSDIEELETTLNGLNATIAGKPSFSDIEELETTLNGLNATIAGKPSFSDIEEL